MWVRGSTAHVHSAAERCPPASLTLAPPPRRPPRTERVRDLVRGRFAWLLLFFAGLMLAAAVVEAFEEVLRQHVELSYFGELRPA